MKKLATVLFCFFILLGSCFASIDVGDYSVEEITDSLCADFVAYLIDNNLIGENQQYGIYLFDSTWVLVIASSDNTDTIFAQFSESNVTFGARSDDDYSNVKEFSILEAINDYHIKYSRRAALYYSKNCLYAGKRISTSGLTVKMLVRELTEFQDFSLWGFMYVSLMTELEKTAFQ